MSKLDYLQKMYGSGASRSKKHKRENKSEPEGIEKEVAKDSEEIVGVND